MDTRDYFRAGDARYNNLMAWCQANPANALASMSFIAAEIADKIGFVALFDLQFRSGGLRLSTPLTPTPVFIEQAGAAAGFLCENFPGEPIMVPMGKELVSNFIGDRVRRLRGENFSNRQIAEHLGIHIRTVERWGKWLGMSGRRASASHAAHKAARQRIGNVIEFPPGEEST